MRRPAFTLIELIVAIALFSVFSVIAIQSTITTQSGVFASQDALRARYLADEGMSAVRAIRDFAWHHLAVPGTYGLDFESNGYWVFDGSTDTHYDGEFTRSVTVSEVLPDLYSVEVEVSWFSPTGLAKSTSARTYFYDSEIKHTFEMTVDADFEAGSLNSIMVDSDQIQLAQTTGLWSYNPETVDLDHSQVPLSFASSGSFLYVGYGVSASLSELFVFDISDISGAGIDSTPVAEIELGASVFDIVVDETGRYLYLATSDNFGELKVVDLTDYSVSSVDVPYSTDARAVGISGGLLVLGTTITAGNEIYVYDISTPDAPVYTGREYDAGGGNVNRIAMFGDIAFVTGADDNELIMVDITQDPDANNPEYAGLAGTDDLFGVAIDEENDRFYLGRRWGLLYECTLPADPLSNDWSDIDIDECSTAVDIGTWVENIQIYEGQVFAIQAALSDHLVVLEAGNITNNLAFDLGTIFAGVDVFVYGQHIVALTEDRDGELKVFTSVTNPWISPLRTDIPLADTEDITSVKAVGDLLYFTRRWDVSGVCNPVDGDSCEMFIFDTNTNTITGGVDIFGNAWDVYVQSDYAYVGTSYLFGEMVIVDVSDESSPTIVGSPFDLGGTNDIFAVTGDGANALYMARENNNAGCNTSTGQACELLVADISDPENLDFSTTTSLHVPNVGSGANMLGLEIDLDNDLLFGFNVSNAGELLIYDISSPLSPVLLSTEDHPGNEDPTGAFFDSFNNVLHIGFNNAEYTVYDIGADSFLPDVFDLGFGNVADISGIPEEGHLFLHTTVNGSEYTLVDISDISAPSVSVELTVDSGDVFTGLYHPGTQRLYMGSSGSNEIQYMQGSSGGGTDVLEGIFTSPVFDTTVSQPTWLELICSLGAASDGSVNLFLRSDSDSSSILAQPWIPASSLPCATSDLTEERDLTSERYIQVQAVLNRGSTTPIIEDITVTYYE